MILALLDFSKAFDTVWHDRLYEILLAIGVPRMMVRWIRGFLSDRRARVRFDGVNGSSIKLQQVVLQGSVLSPLLFLFYINGIRDAAPDGTFISMYADDIAYLFIKVFLPNLILLLSNELFTNYFNMSSRSNTSNFSLWKLQIIIAFNLYCVVLFLSHVFNLLNELKDLSA